MPKTESSSAVLLTLQAKTNAGADDSRRVDPIRLAYLDGLRGLAALGIAIQHLYLRLIEQAGMTSRLKPWPTFSLATHSLVAVFVVLSGYSLMIPVAGSVDGHLTGGICPYFRRRVWRILPAYYAALFFSILPLLPRWIGWPNLPWKSNGPIAINWASVIAHVLLIQNFRADWARQINAPLWAVATEWQLYFVFPFILLPLWRRVGLFATVLISVVTGCAIGYATGTRFDACPWYVGLFAMGMAGSAVNFSRAPQQQTLRARRWLGICILLLLAGAAVINFAPLYLPVTDTIVGAGLAAMLIACTRAVQLKELNHGIRLSGLLRMLESNTAVKIGLVSYSLYLIHGPVINVVAALLDWKFGLHTEMNLSCLPVVACIAVGACTLVFYRVFERPFAALRQRS